MNVGTSSHLFSAHRDVIEAPIPADEAGQRRLLEELKNRAKSAVQVNQWPDAAALYQRATDIFAAAGPTPTTFSAADQAVVQANLSLVTGKMHQWSERSLPAAHRAVQLDPTYTKGWWRLGQAQAALQQYPAALEALDQAMQLEPSNTALIKERSKLVQLQQEWEQKQQQQQLASANTEAPTSSSETIKTVVVEDRPSRPSSSGTADAPSASTSMDVDIPGADDDEAGAQFNKSDFVRGYKIINGKKTSYFHNELSEDAARLIGDIAPKKLDATATVASDGPSSSAQPGASAWNQAGTWEEKDLSTWACQTLSGRLQQVQYTLPLSSNAPGAVVRVTEVKVTGHASVAVVRSKKRYIYELSATLHWSFQHEAVTAQGTLQFADIDGTCPVGEPYEATAFEVKEATDDTVRPLLSTFVHQQGLRDGLHQAIDGWVALFQETY